MTGHSALGWLFMNKSFQCEAVGVFLGKAAQVLFEFCRSVHDDISGKHQNDERLQGRSFINPFCLSRLGGFKVMLMHPGGLWGL